MKKVKIIGTGMHGLVGHQLIDLLQDQYEFTNISRSSGVDITNHDQVMSAVTQSDAQYLLHLAAKADVDGCEQDRQAKEDGEAWRVNVSGTQYLTEACKTSGKTMIYISTDFVFDGTIDVNDSYSEDDRPKPVNWYGYTKYRGEEVVKEATISYLILRLAYPYGKPYDKKKDFVQAMLHRLQNGQSVNALNDHFFTPTYMPDIASAIDRLIGGDYINETFHIVGSQSLTPYEAAKKIADRFGFSHSLIKPISRAEFFLGRAERPYNLSLKNDRIKRLGVEMKSFDAGLEAL